MPIQTTPTERSKQIWAEAHRGQLRKYLGGDEQIDLQDRRHSHDTALEIYWIIKAGSCHRMELLCYR